MPLKLKAEPTFKASVKIPLPGGGESDPVGLTFKHRTKSELKAFLARLNGPTPPADVDSFFEVVAAWDLADEFTRANVELLLENYGRAASVIADAYVRELLGLRRGN